ncbi:NAD(P)-dependent oxidoreductase [Acinetobacter rudis]|uniref:3-hydroxyisobutyrate dehydrogenase n=1 Tax=Acinetobacter rudis CIP 110305 TaxID=421052 RepID=S3MR17_9GAMM|nr:NAD(P)-dependent oxidoreductase [Acinetobacter rudis]EPF70052.1 3-hydroxyisobutyrate dehydrogenase [Acinetobacter rudis CIP 110305]
MSNQQHTKIAFLGMGLMGSRMATRLLNAGFEVAVWNRTATACQALLDLGATPLALEKIAQYPLILTCLSDDAAVQQVYAQFSPYLKAQQVIIDFSSLSVHCTQQLATQAASAQVTWIDSPVSGGVIGAEQGSLVVFAGGDADQIKQLDYLYRHISQRVTCMGAVGTGQATKICNQLIVAANSALIAEATALANQAGVDTTLLAPALAGGFADSKPFQILSPRMATHQFEPVQWKVKTLAKDLNNAVQLAKDCNLKLPVATQALDQLNQHQSKGFAEADLSSLIRQLEQAKSV